MLGYCIIDVLYFVKYLLYKRTEKQETKLYHVSHHPDHLDIIVK